MANKIPMAGMEADQVNRVLEVLQQLLTDSNDLHLILKHVHWNVTGPSFIGVHEMIDPEVDTIRLNADEIAERIATLGGSPKGTPLEIKHSEWAKYPLNRDTVPNHLSALNDVYFGILKEFRAAIDLLGDIDPVSQDMLISQTSGMEKFQWFVRAHLENADGKLVY